MFKHTKQKMMASAAAKRLLAMLRVLVLLLVASSAWGRTARLLEGMFTDALQEGLAPYDPLTVAEIKDVHLVGEHSDFMFSAINAVASGFKMVVVTKFDPPVPPFSNKLTVKLMIPVLEGKTDQYTLVGIHEGEAVSGAGSASVQVAGVRLILNMKTSNYHLNPPSVCIKAGTLSIQLSYDIIEGNLEGMDMINAHLSEELGSIITNSVNEINANAEHFENAFNEIMCK